MSDVARVGGALTVRAVSGDVTIGAIDSELGRLDDVRRHRDPRRS